MNEADLDVKLLSILVRMYNSGYHAGHEDTVEGAYVDVLPVDMDTYHTDEVVALVGGSGDS